MLTVFNILCYYCSFVGWTYFQLTSTQGSSMLFWAHTPQLSGLSIGFVSLSVANEREEGVVAL